MKAERRHELKEDAFVSTVSQVWNFLKTNSKHFLTALLLLVVAGGVYIIVEAQSRKALEDSWGLYSNALHEADMQWTQYQAARDADEETLDQDKESEKQRSMYIEKLKAIRPEIKGTAAEPTYLKNLATMLMQQGTDDALIDAIAAYTDLIENYPEMMFIAYARLDRGKAYFEQGKFADASRDFAAVYEEAQKGEGPAMGLGPQAKWLEARCYENLGDLDRAVSAYEACITAGKAAQFAQFPAADFSTIEGGSRWVDNARQDLKNIRAGLPSTVKERQLKQPNDDETASTD